MVNTTGRMLTSLANKKLYFERNESSHIRRLGPGKNFASALTYLTFIIIALKGPLKSLWLFSIKA
jgi:hypothetical protein